MNFKKFIIEFPVIRLNNLKLNEHLKSLHPFFPHLKC